MCRCILWILLYVPIGLTSALTPVNLTLYLQPNDAVPRDTYLNAKSGSNICARPCVAGEAPKICYYQWTAENYATMGDACGNCVINATECYNNQCITADGYERGVLSINRMIPGPPIEVCLGDRVIVDLTNNMAGRTTAIHWHGLFQQGSQFMDGVPMLTQCSIYEGDTFRYDFIANNEGTHFWHSHDGLQKLDGLEGNLVVRVPQEYDSNGDWYDYDLPEHEIMISDWVHMPADDHFPGLIHSNFGQDADSFLFNGKGRTTVGSQSTSTPYATFAVQQDSRYRMRLVGGLCTVCPTQFSIQNHTMTIIATDGNPVAPTRVDFLNIYSGERYDVVVDANQDAGSYWMHVKGLSTCVRGRVYQLGILTYEDPVTSAPASSAILSDPPTYEGFQITAPRVLNPENGTCASGSGGVCTTQLVNSYPVPQSILKKPADMNIPLTFGFHSFNTKTLFTGRQYDRYFVSPELDLLTSVMNNISFVSPPAPPLTQPEDVPDSLLCGSSTGNNGLPQCPEGQDYCECVHVIKIPLNSTVQILLSDESPRSDLNHPFHLHGYAFNVMEVGQYENGETAQDLLQKIKDNVLTQSPAPALKDTIAVPSGGYAIIKFLANNPGYWFFHCHFVYHLATGMAVVMQVGEKGSFPAPPAGFPKCGNFAPDVYTN